MRTVSAIIAITALFATLAIASQTSAPVEIKVLSASSYTFEAPPLSPPDCNWKDISAYCYSSALTTYIENTMIVEEPNGKRFAIGCTVYAPWSGCTKLPVNRTFQAHMEKNGLQVRFQDEHHKWRRQTYDLLKVEAALKLSKTSVVNKIGR
jgi:hypothetical protein